MRAARLIRVKGLVQGVGFRPTVYRLALEENVAGTVLNDGQGVLIRAEASEEAIERFVARIRTESPALATIDAIEISNASPAGFADFRIIESEQGAVSTGITPDAATCRACLAELFDRRDRRYRYPFINCTHCGPRFTITAHLPYDRPQTSMAKFPMCRVCRAEYGAPENRRFHAQPNACPDCGPRLRLTDARARDIACEDVFEEALARIRNGQILAVKGLGGFHLVCEATNASAVARLRSRKAREAKPLAVMVANLESAERFAKITPAAREALSRVEAPIVLCDKLAETDALLPGVAPGLTALGLMLPYTPVHWLLFFEAAGRPQAGLAAMDERIDLALVMTSANPAGEPLVTGNDEAYERLSGIADAFLVHDRDILLRCDDSVVRATDTLSFIRRARGFTPRGVDLALETRPILAMGAFFKNTACLAKGKKAYLTQHIGELDRAANCRALKDAVEHFCEVLEIAPEHLACDLHPDFYSSSLAEELAARLDCPLTRVQHHHAHIAAVMAEHGLTGPVLGLAIDGVGLGTDGSAWGGELLLVDKAGFTRLSHLTSLAMPGADKCAREGWRMAASVAASLGERLEAGPAGEAIYALLASGARLPETTSLGRYFDAAAAALGVACVSRYEGEAPMILEGIAGHAAGENLPHLAQVRAGELDLRELVLNLARRRSNPAQASRDFHTTLAHALAGWIVAASREHALRDVAVAGGCAMNRLLMGQLRLLLEDAGLTLREAKSVPANDGAVSLGQAYSVMMAQM